jgi:enoyl reductase
MQTVSKRSAALGLALSLALVMGVANSAWAGRTQKIGGGNDDDTIHADAYAVTYSPGKVSPGNPLTPTTTWTPPVCWLAPVATPPELKKERENTWSLGSTGYEWDAADKAYYVDGHPYKNFQLDAGKGYWWNGQPNPSRIADPASLSCDMDHDVWVPAGTKPPTGPAVTPEMLAMSAYDRVRIPDRKISLSPDALHTQTVNVNIWAWLTKAAMRPVSVTARLNSLGIWATTTARPVGLHLEAGTPDAELYPSSGDCPRNSDGSFGQKYQPADGNDPAPCGLKYLRSSNDGTFSLTATVTWAVSWRGSGGTGNDLPNGAFETHQDVTVQEIQAINR